MPMDLPKYDAVLFPFSDAMRLYSSRPSEQSNTDI